MLKADGTKFGKTESGTVWLDPGRTTPYQLYQFFLRSEDAVVGTYLRYFTFLVPRGDPRRWTRPPRRDPERREAQRELARQVCTLVHGAAETERAEQAAAALFGGERRRPRRADAARRVRRRAVDRPAAGPASTVTGCLLVDLLVETGLVGVEEPGPHHRRAGRGLRQQPPGRRRRPPGDAGDLVAGRYVVLRRGKKDHHLVRFD